MFILDNIIINYEYLSWRAMNMEKIWWTRLFNALSPIR